MADTDKRMADFKIIVSEKDRTIISLRGQLNESQDRLKELMVQLESYQQGSGDL
jgi:hypothetical protein